MNIFEKRGAFLFHIVRIPQTSSNIRSKIFYVAYGVKILRTARVTSTKNNFINHYSTLISRMINQGGNLNTITRTLSKVFGRKFEIFSRFFAVLLEFF